VKCPDVCATLGAQHRKQEETRQKSLTAALKRKKELTAQAAALKQEARLALNAAQSRIEALTNKVREAETHLAETEHREKLRLVRGSSSGSGSAGSGKLAILKTLARERVEELRGNLQKVKGQRDSMRTRVVELEELLAKLKEAHNPNFNDAGVKAAVQGWEEYAARETEDHWSDAEERDLEVIAREDDEENGVNWAEFDEGVGEGESDVAALYSFTAYLPPVVRGWLDEKITDLRALLVENGILPASDKGINLGDSKAVQEAKKGVDAAAKDLSNAEKDVKTHQEDLDRDFGPEDGIFRALKDHCVSKDSGEYTYEVCFMGKTKQRPKKGGSETNMGNFVGWDTEWVDEEVGADGRGLGTGERVVMKYENGQHCWNGPNRSTRVVLACAEKDEIWKVSESEKCVYRMEVGTAAVCRATRDGNGAGNGKEDKQGRKDEL
jgi:protein kinase C substrate 80K-H